jgi:glutaredoxin
MPDRAKRLMFCALLLWAVAALTPLPAGAAGMADHKERRVVMYATSGCSYCQQARNYFRQQGIPFVEHDIEKDTLAYRDYKAFGGRGVPVIFVDQRRMNGFSTSGFEKIYRR